MDIYSPQKRSWVMSKIKGGDTKPEMVVRRLLHGCGFRYRLHVRNLPGTPDLVFPSRRKIVNVSGCFWHLHGCARSTIPATRRDWWLAKLLANKARDARTARQLRKLGWELITVWECQTKNREKLRARLVRFLK